MGGFLYFSASTYSHIDWCIYIMSEKKVGLGKQQVELVGLLSESLHIYLTVFAEIYKFIGVAY